MEHFILAVSTHLIEHGEVAVTDNDMELIHAAIHYCVGPYDTACQIIDNRKG